jgi:hypothetical protein
MEEFDAAIRATMEDLLRTVEVRDQTISIKGVTERRKNVKHSVEACHIPADVLKEPEITDILKAIVRRGGGKAGLKRLVDEICEMDGFGPTVDYGALFRS